MTERLVRWIGRQALEYTYAELAKQIGIDDDYEVNLGTDLPTLLAWLDSDNF